MRLSALLESDICFSHLVSIDCDFSLLNLSSSWWMVRTLESVLRIFPITNKQTQKNCTVAGINPYACSYRHQDKPFYITFLLLPTETWPNVVDPTEAMVNVSRAVCALLHWKMMLRLVIAVTKVFVTYCRTVSCCVPILFFPSCLALTSKSFFLLHDIALHPHPPQFVFESRSPSCTSWTSR